MTPGLSFKLGKLGMDCKEQWKVDDCDSLLLFACVELERCMNMSGAEGSNQGQGLRKENLPNSLQHDEDAAFIQSINFDQVDNQLAFHQHGVILHCKLDDITWCSLFFKCCYLNAHSWFMKCVRF